jgi:hypothetical protein
MATTSGALAPGKAPAGHGNNHPGRWAAALAAAALGLALLIGGILAQGRPAAEPAAAPVASSIPAVARPQDASTSGDFRWDYGEVRGLLRPRDASTSTEFRWDDERYPAR